MKIRELAEYCNEIHNDCGDCDHKTECEILQNAVYENAPSYIVQMVDENIELK